MSNSILNSEEFGQKIYDRFPIVYKSEDVKQNFTLKRYIQAIADGGFRPAIDEINGILELKDSNNTPLDVLMLLYEELGLELFNGIPESYLRYFFPQLADAWAKKGSLNAVKVVASALSGVKVSIEVYQSEEGMYMSMLNTNNVLNFDFVTNMHSGNYVNVHLEMDYDVSEHYFPDTRQFERLLKNFLPFYLDCFIIYTYVFDDYPVFKMREDFTDLITEHKEEEGLIEAIDMMEDFVSMLYEEIGTINPIYSTEYLQPTLNNEMRTLNETFVLNEFCYVDDFVDDMKEKSEEFTGIRQEELSTDKISIEDISSGEYGEISALDNETKINLMSNYEEEDEIGVVDDLTLEIMAQLSLDLPEVHTEEYSIANIEMDSFTFYETLNTPLELNGRFQLNRHGGDWGFINSSGIDNVINDMRTKPISENSAINGEGTDTFNGLFMNSDITLNEGIIVVPDTVDVIIRNGVREIVYPRISI